jgi:hypothetical protein
VESGREEPATTTQHQARTGRRTTATTTCEEALGGSSHNLVRRGARTDGASTYKYVGSRQIYGSHFTS